MSESRKSEQRGELSMNARRAQRAVKHKERQRRREQRRTARNRRRGERVIAYHGGAQLRQESNVEPEGDAL